MSEQERGFPPFPTLLRKPLVEREMALLARAREHAADFRLRAAEHDRENSFAAENYESMKESGYAHMTLPAAQGGEDVSLLELCACQEQLAQGCAGTAVGINMHLFGLGSLIHDRDHGPEERAPQINLVLGLVGMQKAILSASFSELGTPGAYNLPGTVATKTEGGWRIDGKKAFVSNFPAADVVGAWVTVEDGEGGKPKVAMAMVPTATPGLTSPGESSWDVLGVRASGSWQVDFDGVELPEMMVTPAQPAAAIFEAMGAFGAWFSISISATYLGVAQAATDWVKEYLKGRTPAGLERPLSHMAGLQYQLAEMVALNEASRAVIRSAAEDWEARGWSPEEAMAKGSMCKYVVTNNHVRVVELAMEIAGGPGLFRDAGLERHYRDVRGAKVHPPSDMIGLEWIGKWALGIPYDAEPRWG